MAKHLRVTASVLGAPIDVLEWDGALSRIGTWAAARESRYVCVCNVHSVVMTKQDTGFMQVVSEADMATPDGMPVAWMLRLLGFAGQERINGPDLMWKYCARAAANGESIFLYGGMPATLDILRAKLLIYFPGLNIAGTYSAPFREMTSEEDSAVVQSINNSGAGVVWVSLGCPKQEKWMAAHRDRVNAVMIGVGAALEFHAGTTKRAPLWMQRYGLEWLHRLCSESDRLWKRYLVTNTLFIFGAIRQLLFHRS